MQSNLRSSNSSEYGKSEVINPDGQPIPHLYEAGELGAPFPSQYIAGGNLADCLISGKSAGENAATKKAPIKTIANVEETVTDFNPTSDLNKEEFELDHNQYLGKSNAGMGGELVVRVTVDDDQNITNVEVLKQSETEEISAKALATLPKLMVEQNTYEVDAVSGASRTDTALKEAVKDALSQVK
ncbi:FMN-binding protein [Lactobacillus sp. ESL0684]|uniref:FMN-binding protein n=1 Tax=Lactobacillus sp. ESL0684 TaxID=2983213 RepID=UPI0023F705FC|nr:FMN-binding protein [Lactobacillus sp. ESL0684]WEV43868.1 FMN-binding protein [Lactobacillus sp. ESL0684]